MVRLASGIVLAAAAIGAILFLPLQALAAIAVLVSALGAHEYLRITAANGSVRRLATTIATGGLCAAVAFQAPLDPIALLLAALAWVAVDVLATGRRVEHVAADLLAPIYVGAPLGMLVGVQAIGGWRASLLLVTLVIVSDSAQYYSGRAFGRHPLAPTISPKKTVEGFIGGLVCGTAFMTVAGSNLFPSASRLSLAAVGASIVVLGVCGDLFESRLKRVAGLKDSAALIPGHGGVLDRIDALLFAAPAFYVYLRGGALAP
jgi:phosphatidate cytidylyltransferase